MVNIRYTWFPNSMTLCKARDGARQLLVNTQRADGRGPPSTHSFKAFTIAVPASHPPPIPNASCSCSTPPLTFAFDLLSASPSHLMEPPRRVAETEAKTPTPNQPRLLRDREQVFFLSQRSRASNNSSTHLLILVFLFLIITFVFEYLLPGG